VVGAKFQKKAGLDNVIMRPDPSFAPSPYGCLRSVYLHNFEEKFSGYRWANRWPPGSQLHAEYFWQQLRVRVGVEVPGGRQLETTNSSNTASDFPEMAAKRHVYTSRTSHLHCHLSNISSTKWRYVLPCACWRVLTRVP